jgi:membrane protease YdiL (CAAX protease family)
MASRSSAFDLGELTARTVASSVVTSESTPPEEPRGPLGMTVFTLEGRAAPALFLVGWLASLLGFGATIVAALAGSGLAGVILFAASVSSTLFLSALLGSFLIRLGLSPEAPLFTLVGSLVILGSYLGLVRFLVVGTGALTWREIGLRAGNRGFAEDAAWGVALAVPVLTVTGIVAALLSTFLPLPDPVLPPATDTAGVLMNLAVAAVIAPIGEEIFFRGFATTAWARVYGARRALIQGAIFFAVAHVLTLGAVDPVQGLKLALFASLVRLPVALTLGWLFLRRRSLVGPIFLHAAYNGLPIIALAAGLGNTPGT